MPPTRPPVPTPARPPAPPPPPTGPHPDPSRSRAQRLAHSVPDLIKHLPQHKPWMIALSVIAVVVVIATCGLGSYMLVKDDSTVVGASPTPTPTVATRDITDRETDPSAMKVGDVFPAAEVPAADPTVRSG